MQVACESGLSPVPPPQHTWLRLLSRCLDDASSDGTVAHAVALWIGSEAGDKLGAAEGRVTWQLRAIAACLEEDVWQLGLLQEGQVGRDGLGTQLRIGRLVVLAGALRYQAHQIVGQGRLDHAAAQLKHLPQPPSSAQ